MVRPTGTRLQTLALTTMRSATVWETSSARACAAVSAGSQRPTRSQIDDTVARAAAPHAAATATPAGASAHTAPASTTVNVAPATTRRRMPAPCRIVGSAIATRRMLATADEHRSGSGAVASRLGGQFGDGFRDDDARGRLDEREVRERLREVAEVPAGLDVELLRVEAER